jgi:alcohol dehydrogenase
MRALVLREHGDNDKLLFEPNYPTPKAGEGDVVVRVKASSINYHDVFTRRGMPGIKVPLPVIIGLDVVGEISEIGAGVTSWKVGDRVLIDPVNRVEGGLSWSRSPTMSALSRRRRCRWLTAPRSA